MAVHISRASTANRHRAYLSHENLYLSHDVLLSLMSSLHVAEGGYAFKC